MGELNKSLDDNMSLMDYYYISNMILSKLRHNPEYRELADLMLLLDRESFTKIVHYYSGESFTVPTKEEYLSISLFIKVYYEVNYHNKSIKEALMDEVKSESLVNKYYEKYKLFVKEFESIKVPKNVNE